MKHYLHSSGWQSFILRFVASISGWMLAGTEGMEKSMETAIVLGIRQGLLHSLLTASIVPLSK